MHGNTLLIDFIIILCAVVVCVPLLQRLRLGSFLGHLVAGVLIGPFGLALVGDLESLGSLAELGVVFLLFAVGLELPISRLKVMPIGVFLLGIAQVVVTGAIIGICAVGLGATVDSAIVIGGALALSSTAVVLVLLSEHGELTSRFGRFGSHGPVDPGSDGRPASGDRRYLGPAGHDDGLIDRCCGA